MGRRIRSLHFLSDATRFILKNELPEKPHLLRQNSAQALNSENGLQPGFPYCLGYIHKSLSPILRRGGRP